ncbi:MAG: respiratory nitrate reductase subunit gamma [Acidiferrobacterales bacterium]
MSAVTVVFALMFYAATAILVFGLLYKTFVYARTPQPFKIPTTPAPITKAGVVWRITKEVTVFSSLFKASKWTWLFGWMFHAALVLVLLRHLRYFTEPVWVWIALLQPFGKYAAFAMLAGLLGLWARRFLVDRVRYISSPSDHLMLALLVAIGGTGAAMKFIPAAHTDIIALKVFILGLMRFDWQPLNADLVLLVHLSLVIILMAIFPISKLLHVPGIFFHPTRYMTDNARDKRYVRGWSANADVGSK